MITVHRHAEARRWKRTRGSSSMVTVPRHAATRRVPVPETRRTHRSGDIPDT